MLKSGYKFGLLVCASCSVAASVRQSVLHVINNAESPDSVTYSYVLLFIH